MPFVVTSAELIYNLVKIRECEKLEHNRYKLSVKAMLKFL